MRPSFPPRRDGGSSCTAAASAIVLAVDLETLVADARRADGVIEFLPQVGDFVATGEPLFELYGGAVSITDQSAAGRRVAFGSERTMEQDPLFAFRIIADVALKALSPAINDPTTGVLALDQLNRLLRVVGRRRLRSATIEDRTGTPRVIYRTPDWEDFVNVSCTEIRACGAGNVQIARRMRAMLDNLVATLPAHRHAALDAERRRLDLVDCGRLQRSPTIGSSPRSRTRRGWGASVTCAPTRP